MSLFLLTIFQQFDPNSILIDVTHHHVCAAHLVLGYILNQSAVGY